jgi:hypothetical protein
MCAYFLIQRRKAESRHHANGYRREYQWQRVLQLALQGPKGRNPHLVRPHHAIREGGGVREDGERRECPLYSRCFLLKKPCSVIDYQAPSGTNEAWRNHHRLCTGEILESSRGLCFFVCSLTLNCATVKGHVAHAYLDPEGLRALPT